LAKAAEIKAMTPDATQYTIVDFERVGPHLVMKVLYPNCRKCSYEGNKVLVYLNVSEIQVLKWKKMDPHFRDPKKPGPPDEAPGPNARFPASQEGWEDAKSYARSKLQGQRFERPEVV
jgi:hypothetical protein